MIAVIDYDAGNLKSVEKALQYIGAEAHVTRKFQEIQAASHVILPGVGSFGMAMEQLKKYGLDKAIKEVVAKQTPFLGICLGLQLLFSGSEESSGVEGLGLLKGSIVKIPAVADLKIPHIGWNSLTLKNEGRLFQEMESEVPYVYFVHSYYLKAEEKEIVKATTGYGVTIDASVESGNLFACQFHPEKSGRKGLRILRNFVELTGGAR